MIWWATATASSATRRPVLVSAIDAAAAILRIVLHGHQLANAQAVDYALMVAASR